MWMGFRPNCTIKLQIRVWMFSSQVCPGVACQSCGISKHLRQVCPGVACLSMGFLNACACSPSCVFCWQRCLHCFQWWNVFKSRTKSRDPVVCSPSCVWLPGFHQQACGFCRLTLQIRNQKPHRRCGCLRALPANVLDSLGYCRQELSEIFSFFLKCLL